MSHMEPTRRRRADVAWSFTTTRATGNLNRYRFWVISFSMLFAITLFGLPSAISSTFGIIVIWVITDAAGNSGFEVSVAHLPPPAANCVTLFYVALVNGHCCLCSPRPPWSAHPKIISE